MREDGVGELVRRARRQREQRRLEARKDRPLQLSVARREPDEALGRAEDDGRAGHLDARVEDVHEAVHLVLGGGRVGSEHLEHDALPPLVELAHAVQQVVHDGLVHGHAALLGEHLVQRRHAVDDDLHEREAGEGAVTATDAAGPLEAAARAPGDAPAGPSRAACCRACRQSRTPWPSRATGERPASPSTHAQHGESV